MKTRLAEELRRYYFRRGTRVIFSGGLSLNQLALEMWDRLDQQKVDSSVISRVLSGERLFSLKQLAIFCEVIKIGDTDCHRLKDALKTDLITRYGLADEFFTSQHKNFIHLVSDNLDKIRALKSQSLLGFLGDWILAIIARIEEELSINSDPVYRRRLLTLYGQILVEATHWSILCAPPTESRRLTLHLANKLLEIGDELNHPSFIGLAHWEAADSLYTQKRFSQAIQLYHTAYSLTEPYCLAVSRQFPYRGLALCQAYLKQDSEFARTKKLALANLPSHSPDIQCSVWEGLARAEAVLGHPRESDQALSAAKGFLHQNRLSLLREIQVTRTEIESAVALNTTRHKDYLEKIGSRALAVATDRHYHTHQQKITDLLARLL